MEVQGTSYSISTEFTFIDSALKAQWRGFEELCVEAMRFVPKDVGDFSDHRANELLRLKKLNPQVSEDVLLKDIDFQIAANAQPWWQFYQVFNERIMSSYVTVAFLSHALSEAVINTILGIGLGKSQRSDLFEMIERTDVRKKWEVVPKILESSYAFPKNGSLHETFVHLTRERNAFVHYKIELEVGGVRQLKGSSTHSEPLPQKLDWLRRYFSLPYDLLEFARHQLPWIPVSILRDADPIQRYIKHKVAPQP